MPEGVEVVVPALDDATANDPPRFVIDSPEAATWAADVILTARQRLERIKASSAAQIAAAERDVAIAEGRFLAELQLWARDNLPRGKRSVLLATGQLRFRTVPKRTVLADEAAARRWAHRYLPDAIKVKVETTVSATALKAYYTETGERPDGLEDRPAEETFSVTAPKTADE